MGHGLQFDPRFGSYSGLDEPTDDAVTVYPNSGETLQQLAKTLGVDPDQLALANPTIYSSNQPLLPTQQINVPKDLNPHFAAPPSPDKADVKPTSSPRAGEVQDIAKQMAQLNLNEQATTDLSRQALQAGLNATEVSALAGQLKSLPPSEFDREAALLRDALHSQNPDRALRTYLDVAPMRQAHPDRITPDIERTLVMGVGTSRTSNDLGHEGVLGQDGAQHAADALVNMPESEYKQVAGALAQAGRGGGPNGSPQMERALILKAVGAREESLTNTSPIDQARLSAGLHKLSTDQITQYAAAIRGKSRDELVEKSTVMDLKNGTGGLQQRFTCSCAPTAAQITEAEADPIAAWHMHDQAIHSTSTDSNVAGPQGDALAKGGRIGFPRDFPAIGQVAKAEGIKEGGMPEADALNQIAAGATHRRYDTEEVDDSPQARKSALDQMEGPLRRGVDVPIQVMWDRPPLVTVRGTTVQMNIDGYNNPGSHALVASDVKGSSPNREFLITDPWNGKTGWVKESDIVNGSTTFFAGTGRLGSIFPGKQD